MGAALLTPTFEDAGALLEEALLLDGLDLLEDAGIIHLRGFVIIEGGECYS
jgi:hypothetical protein